MSERADRERDEEAKRQANRRAEEVCLELLALLRAEREGLAISVVADRVGRPVRTLFRRKHLLQLMEKLKRYGVRRTPPGRNT